MENAKCYAPKILVSTEDLPREQWLEYRRKGIGGSDAAAVLGISPFRTGRDLYYDKLNIVTADDAENWVQLEVGTLLEPLVAKIFAHKTGYKIYRRPFMFQHPLYPWMLADLDYMVELPDGTSAILEIKTTNYNAKDNWWYNGEEIVPIYYESQGRHYRRPCRSAAGGCSGVGSHGNCGLSRSTIHLNEGKEVVENINGFTITQRNAVVEQHLWCIDTIMAQYAAFMQTEPVDPDDVYQSLAVRLIRAVNSYDPRKGYLKEYILSQLKREMVRIRSTQAVYGLTQAPANIGSTIVPLTIAAQRESYWETYIAV